ncbi:50S ribosomal protein L10 [Candidatus Woesearchaeota archaeon]|nr:50S ribosomal protein L10 [Candidatus Woesearchaeota archaeon]
MGEVTHNAALEKKDVVKQMVQCIKDYPIVGVVNMESLPSTQLQFMRRDLRGRVELLMTKISLTGLALEEASKFRKDINTALKPYIKGMPALLFTKDNPFSLFRMLKKSKSPAAAKPGQKAPKNITVPAGPTPFTPGPVISEFAALGIKAGVEGGKVAVKQDTVVCKEGQEISAPLASMLARLGITPMEVGLDLVAVYENGVVYPKNVLDIDENAFLASITQAASEAFNLAIDIALPIKDTVELLLQKSFREAKAVALEANILADVVVEELVEKAEREMLSLKNVANISDVIVNKGKVKKEEPKVVEKKESSKKVEEKNIVADKELSKPVEVKKEEHPPVEQKKEMPAPVVVKESLVQSTVDKMIIPQKPMPSAEKIVDDVKKETPKDEIDAQKRKKEIEEIEALTKKLVKKGTLR